MFGIDCSKSLHCKENAFESLSFWIFCININIEIFIGTAAVASSAVNDQNLIRILEVYS